MTRPADALIEAAAGALRPFAKRLLHMGVPFGAVERRLRALFIEVAQADFTVGDRRATDSRIALLTGINRKEVRRLRAGETSDGGRFALNHVASLISRWTTDKRTVDGRGRPRPLPYRAARGPSFMQLARAVTSDLAPGVLLEQLVASGAGELREAGVVALCAPALVARSGSPEALQVLAEDPAELAETMLQNVLGERDTPLLQRKVAFDNLGSEAADRVRAELRREGERFLAKMERVLARYDRDRNPGAPGGDRHYAGLGVYCFETAPAPRPSPAPVRPRARRKRKERTS
jgi:hypothetical protein